MKCKYLLLLIILLAFVAPCNGVSDFRTIYPDFDLSLQRYGYSRFYYQKYYHNPNLNKTAPYFLLKNVLTTLFNQDKDRCYTSGNPNKIPRIIHQIWLGGPFPEKYKEWAATWMNWDGWEYWLWLDEDIKQLSLINSNLYQNAENYGAKSDILRYEILHQYGGLYIDTDCKCNNSEFFEFAHQEYSFYLGIEPLENCPKIRCGNAILGAAPGHVLLGKIIDEMAEHVTHCRSTRTVDRTGPGYITNQIFKYSQLLGDDGIVFPPTFFYPISGLENEYNNLMLFLNPETASIHFWERSWLIYKLQPCAP